MSDRARLWLSVILFLLSLFLPWIILLAGWSYWDFRTGLILGVASLVFILGGAVFILFRIKDLSNFSSSLPYLFGTLYAILPDGFISPIDDGILLGAGAVLTFVLEQRRNPHAPKWVFIFPGLALLYVFLGGFLPGPFDELVVGGILYAGYLYANTRQPSQAEHIIPN